MDRREREMRGRRRRCQGGKCRRGDDDDDDGGKEGGGEPLQLLDNLASYETLCYVKTERRKTESGAR